MSKQQILFVDDEPMVLAGLQRTLRPQRGEWDMVFVESGAMALEHMAAQPFDVIISDMLMPRMNGAELLKEVVRRHPATVRMVLSGHADKELISQCVGVAHQFISKPCDPEQLKALVKNACQLAGGLLDGEVKQVIGTIDRLPSAPEVFLDLREALARPEVNTRQLGAIIQRDPGMTAKTLQLVNSAFFGMRKSVTDPQEAVAYLGVEIVRTQVLSNGIFEASSPFPTQVFKVAEVWRHSLLVARVAQALAKQEGLPLALQREAYAGGLLHDVGVLILASRFPNLYDQVAEAVRAKAEPLRSAEEWLFGVSHAEVGAYLLGLWGLPAQVLEIVSLHHQPRAIAGEGLSPALAVHAADVICGGAAGEPVLFGLADFDPELLRWPWFGERLAGWRAVGAAAMQQGTP